MDIYQALFRPILFSGVKVDPEWLHQQSFRVLGWLDQTYQSQVSHWLRAQLHRTYCLDDPRLQQCLWSITFTNPLGLAAGFDKDGVASGLWADFGFGFAELGTVTFHPQPGNPRPRLFRLLTDRAVLNRMGFNNQGAAVMAERLRKRWGQRGDGRGDGGDRPPSTAHFPLGINLGKSKITPLEEAAQDYLNSFRLLKDWGDYFVVNVSSPNTPGLRSLQDKVQLAPILQALQQENTEQKPLLVKIAPDLEWAAIADVLELAQEYHLAGIIATNTTIQRDGLKTRIIEQTGKPVTEEAGGISGVPIRARSTEVIRFIYKETQGQLPIIGVGGIFTAADAWEKITAGASLIQVYAGWIYEGPWMVRRILQGLLQKLDAEGLESIQQAVGRGN
ncbi:quinone-dependent dihydroorotate dehydrogenase [Leptodesmis sp.]|uniref:quinone-dependent dihydroorotate dehydrogenase n=1 Tax=Leptodesmis sp. TaxID=3100501 RepID=UPI004053535F